MSVNLKDQLKQFRKFIKHNTKDLISQQIGGIMYGTPLYSALKAEVRANVNLSTWFKTHSETEALALVDRAKSKIKRSPKPTNGALASTQIGSGAIVQTQVAQA